MRNLIVFLSVAFFIFLWILRVLPEPQADYKLIEIKPSAGHKTSFQLNIDPYSAMMLLKTSLLTGDFYKRQCYLKYGLKSEDGEVYHFGTESFYYSGERSNPSGPLKLNLSTPGGYRTLSFITNEPGLLAGANFVINFSNQAGQTSVSVITEHSAVYIGKEFNAHVGGMIPRAIHVEHLRLDELALLTCIADFYEDPPKTPSPRIEIQL